MPHIILYIYQIRYVKRFVTAEQRDSEHWLLVSLKTANGVNTAFVGRKYCILREGKRRIDYFTKCSNCGSCEVSVDTKLIPGDELLALVPDFDLRSRSLVERMVYGEENAEMLLDGLRKAGLKTPQKNLEG
jgi:hypothetical protein